MELVRLGITAADDPAIHQSLLVVDKLIKVNTTNGPAWYRYNHDAYGERPDGSDYDARSGKGRLWTLLTGERGEYELARGNLRAAHSSLYAMMKFANDGLMIPEQVWDEPKSPRPELRFGEGTGSATPLAWSMAQFIRLAANVRARRNLETPALVRTPLFSTAVRKLMAKTQEKIDLVFAADLGGTHLRAAAIDEKGHIYARVKTPTPQTSRPNEIVRALVEAAHECEEQTSDRGVIRAISVAVPGTVDVDEGVVVKAPNVPCLDGFRLAAALESELHLPAIVENDANAAAVGEMWQGAARGVDTIICITLGTGLGWRNYPERQVMAWGR